MRLKSLDILRGLDLWFLLIVGPVYRSFYSCCHSDGAFIQWVNMQMRHVDWVGFTAWDIIMPLFMFMSGITIPFSMAKYKAGVTPDKSFYLKLLRRFVLLFFLGWIAQGNLLTFDPKLFHPFANTLQAIAVGYVASALMFVHFRPKFQIILTSALFLVYLGSFVFSGMDFNPETNIAMVIDKAVLGCHRDGVVWHADGTWTFNPEYQYTWILSSLNFIVTVMMGCFAGQVLCSHERSVTARKAWMLAGIGAALIVAGLLMSPWFPIIKKIWSSSMTLLSGGICYLLMAVTYYLIDVRKCPWEMKGIASFGMNSIAVWPKAPAECRWNVAPGKPLIISEFGGEAMYGVHGNAGKAWSWSEDYQEQMMRDNLEMFDRIENLAGISPWVLFDFRSPTRLHPVNQEGWNRKGLLSDQGMKKKAWYVIYEYYKNK